MSDAAFQSFRKTDYPDYQPARQRWPQREASRDLAAEIEVTEEYLFPSIVWYADILGAEDMNRELIARIADLRTQVPSVKKSNEQGWHSPTDMHKREEFAPLCACIEAMAGTVSKSMKMPDNRRFSIDTFWVNINPKHAYNALHDHPKTSLSGVYYVQADDRSGRLRFRDPRAAKRMDPWPVAKDEASDLRHWDRVNYKPIPGRMILFPSWLEHDVEPNLSDQERISIAFNMTL